MLLESRGIGLTVLCGVLSLGQHTGAGEARCVLEKYGVQEEQKGDILLQEKVFPEGHFLV